MGNKSSEGKGVARRINAAIDLSLEQAFDLSDTFSELLDSNADSLSGAKAFADKH
ncbi:hypothetical protein LPY66_17670 [Dehalobacter sp. DCM]|uniref:hypothetical protein n=1 Tax=Dehalobacter sp. DCM TaxID=2907827 RepID=UPI0030814335|nr:hypothetical protein LPY66_17670 [Dehalobacter sp. DCM]